MTARATTLTSQSGAQKLVVLTNPDAEWATVVLEHVDEFDSSRDSVTVGEFAARDIIAALVPPVPATTHVANVPPKRIRRRWWRK